jgi:hypothetical protein
MTPTRRFLLWLLPVWVLSFLLGVLGGLWMTADAQAPVPHSYDELHELRGEAKAMAADSAYTQYHGAVGCDAKEDVPVIQRLLVAGDTLAQAETDRHEAMHFIQLARTGCRETIALWQHSPLAWLLAEAQASCAGFEVYGADREKRHARMLAMILVVAFRRPPGISMGDVWEAFTQACGEPAGVDSSYRP